MALVPFGGDSIGLVFFVASEQTEIFTQIYLTLYGYAEIIL